jgi:hypothetical protein
MSAPFDTLQLARGFEAAGFPLDQASNMAEAVAAATIGADLKADLKTGIKAAGATADCSLWRHVGRRRGAVTGRTGDRDHNHSQPTAAGAEMTDEAEVTRGHPTQWCSND